jgi:hypothetical protein
MHHDFKPPHIKHARTAAEWFTAVQLWWAFRSMRASGEAHE